jgi:hypothetical protein
VPSTLLAPSTAAARRCRPSLERDGSCGLRALASVELSESGGLGRVEIAGKTGAALQRDEGIVTLLDLSAARPKVLGRYDDGAQDSYDGDLAFSDDGRWLFYARQTHEFSKDGLHVLDVSDPKQPSLATYAPAGGAFRVAYHEDDSGGWVFVLDAIAGLLVYRFEPTTGQVVPVYVDALPALKVGGPASAGIHIDGRDPMTGAPLAYVTTGSTGLQIFDISDPAAPVELGAWSDMGLAEIEVVASKTKRTVYAAPEYWFAADLPSEVVVLDATDPSNIKRKAGFALPDVPASDPNDLYRLQGMALQGRDLYVAHSSAGLAVFDVAGGALRGHWRRSEAANETIGVTGAPYAMDVEIARGRIYLTDAATGTLTILR